VAFYLKVKVGGDQYQKVFEACPWETVPQPSPDHMVNLHGEYVAPGAIFYDEDCSLSVCFYIDYDSPKQAQFWQKMLLSGGYEQCEP
jgi:hypothetical protein